MKRQIITALSLTLLVSSPLTLNATRKKKIPSNTTAQQPQSTDNKTDANTSSPRTLIAPPSTPVDEFSPESTKAQRAALFVAIGALANQSNKGLKPIDKKHKVDHELERQRVIQDLYTYDGELHSIIAAPAASSSSVAPITASAATQSAQPTELEERLAVSYLAARYRLKKTQQLLSAAEDKLIEFICRDIRSGKQAIDLFPGAAQASQAASIPTITELQQQLQRQQAQEQLPSTNPFRFEQPSDDFDKASISSSNGDKVEFPEDLANPATSSSSSTTAAAANTTPTTTTAAPAAGGSWFGISWFLGSAKK